MATVVLGLCFLAMAVLAARTPRVALLATVFMAPWNGFDVDVGLRISGYQIVVAALLLVTAARSLQPGWHPARPAAGRLLAGFVVFAAVWSLTQVAFIPDAEIAAGALRAPVVRATIQVALLFFTVSPALLLAWSMRTKADIEAIFRTYLFSVAVLAVIGWLQLIVWYGTGSNPLPIGIVNDWLGGSAETRVGSFDFAALAINRMNSFAGEPRQLGGALVFAMLLIQSVMLTARHVDWRRLAPLWAFFLVTAIPTYSTSAVAIWLIGTAVQLTMPRLLGIRIERSPGQLLVAVVAVTVPIALAITIAEARGIPVIDLIADRTINRIEDNGAVEDFDLAILDYFQAHPEASVLGTGLGNAHLYAGAYLRPEFRWYAEGVVFTAKPQYLRIVSEVGLVGLALFLSWYAVLLIDVARAVRRAGSTLAPLVPAAVMALAVFLATGSVAGEFWTMAGTLMVAATALGAGSRAAARPGALISA